MPAMSRLKFGLTSDQLELLLAFEGAQGLGHLAELMARDSSVVSRNLQRIAEDFPVLEKVKGRWQLTPLGLRINEQTKVFLETHAQLLTAKNKSTPKKLSERSALVIINAQNGLLDAVEDRNNSEAEVNMARLLAHWRTKKWPVIHVKHVSSNPASAFFRGSSGCEFLEMVTPLPGETVVEKTKSSAFAGTDLAANLAQAECSRLVLIGFTANECIDATARDAASLEYETFVAGDAVATFDLREPSGKLIRADRIHRLTMANIHAFYAKVISSSEALV